MCFFNRCLARCNTYDDRKFIAFRTLNHNHGLNIKGLNSQRKSVHIQIPSIQIKTEGRDNN